jgi:hypothetical protein
LPGAGDPSAVHDLEPSNAEPHVPKGKSAQWVAFFIPSIADLIFVLLLVALAAGPLAQKMLGDAGIGWHIRTGQLILRTDAIPRVDPFSATMQGKPWYAWEWMYDVGVGALDAKTGLNGVVFFNALVIALTFAFVFRKMLARGAGLGVALGMLLLAFSSSSIHFLARPHVVSWLFTVIFFDVLEAFEDDGNVRKLLWLPALMLVWVNVHGGFLVGLVLIGIYFVAYWVGSLPWSEPAGSEVARRRAKALALVGLACTAITLANPYGYHLHAHIYRYLSDPFLMNHIDEFLSPNFHGLAQRCFAVILLLTILGAAVSPKRLGARELMLIAFAAYSGLYATRNIPVASILLTLVMGPHFSAALEDWFRRLSPGAGIRAGWERFRGLSTPMLTMESTRRGHLWTTAVVLGGVWVCLHQGRFGSRQIMDAHFSPTRFPVATLNWLKANGVRDAVLCPDSWGGYLIYRQDAGIQPLVDDRHDLYGAAYLKNYLKLMHVEPGWEGVLEQSRASWVVLPLDAPLASVLRGAPGWKMVHSDETAIVFVRG